MANNRLVFEGLDALRADLRNLPSELTGEASGIVDNRGELAKSEIIQRYPRWTGNLREHVTLTTVNAGQFGAGVVVKNTAKHAHWIENGTEARHYFTKATGAKHLTGKMPARPVFVPVVMRHRRSMYQELADLLKRHGLAVSGSF